MSEAIDPKIQPAASTLPGGASAESAPQTTATATATAPGDAAKADAAKADAAKAAATELAKGTEAAKTTDKPKEKTVAELVAEGIADATKKLTDHVEKLTAKQTADQAVTKARDAFIKERMNKMPETYQDMLPRTDDKATLEKAAVEIGNRMKADIDTLVKSGAVKYRNLGGDPGGYSASSGQPAVNAPRTPSELVSEGLRTAKMAPEIVNRVG